MHPPPPETYWVKEGRLLAGAYPSAKDEPEAGEKLRRLREAGIDVFVDLTEEGERAHDGSTLRPYVDAVAPAKVVRHAVRDLDVPTVEEMREILDTIDDALAAGRNVYVHCWGGIGRTGTVVGCWLVRHGMSADEALDLVETRRRARRRSPETDAQRAFVRAWRPGS